MNKKIIKFLLPITILSTLSCLTSCSEKPFTGKVHLDYGEIKSSTITKWEELNWLAEYDDFVSLVNNKESFILTMYGNPGCGCWTTYFAPNLVDYYNETHTRIYVIGSSEFERKEKYGLYTEGNDLPSLAIFNRGKLVYQTVYYRDSKQTFDDYDTMCEWISSRTIKPKIYTINVNILDNFISTDKEFNLYVSLEGCGDCSALKKNILYPWIDKVENISSPIYELELNGANKVELKDKYGLSTVNNPNLGWKTGFMPTLQRRTGSTITDMITVYNDKYNSTTHLMESYFNESRVSFMNFLKDDTTINPKILDGIYIEKYNTDEYRKKYQDPIINLYFNTYIK